MSNSASHRASRDLDREKASLLRSLPLKSEIFLPTSRIPLEEQISGLKRVKRLYESDLEKVHQPKLRELRNGLTGKKRCFLIGNGPSLNKTDLNLLKGEVTFAVNGFFLKSEDLNWTPTFYVVEDHLVAEDRAKQIQQFKGPIKFFPAYLAYCLPGQEDTIFYNHRPRKSFPNGFDFSLQADEVTFTGCTVIYSAMQLAAYLGFEEIYLIGVDADYEIPKNTKISHEYGTSVLDMKTDDPNHFHPDYFGKGFRWHDPQLNKMLQAYEEAYKVCKSVGIQIMNATVGGKLEVFPRVDFNALFTETQKNRTKLPRLLLVDFTRFGQSTATGELKQKYFSSWDDSNILHLYGEGGVDFGHSRGSSDDGKRYDLRSTIEQAKQFGPDIILYRPVADHRALHHLAMTLISGFEVPYVIWMMDDWPARQFSQDPALGAASDGHLKILCQNANACLAISEPMAGAFGARYGANFEVFHNGIIPDDWSGKAEGKGSRSPVKIRYSGALASDMVLRSMKEIADAVKELSKTFDLKFEIRCQSHWLEIARKEFGLCPEIEIETANLSVEDYRQWLKNADVLVVCNNFDKNSFEYIKYSFANKIPEYLASGQAVLAYGPKGASSMDFLSRCPGVTYVGTQDGDAIKGALEMLITDAKTRNKLARRSQKFAFQNLNFNQMKNSFEELMITKSLEPSKKLAYTPSSPNSTKRFYAAYLNMKKKKPYSSLLSSIRRYVLGWKGFVGIISPLLMISGVFLFNTASGLGLKILASGFIFTSQIALFGLIAHLAAHMENTKY